MKRQEFATDLVLPVILFAALGGMTWAVRGCSGYGASAGCLFAGVTWGAAWWFISHEPGIGKARPYSSGWVIPAFALGFYLAGNRGWMQWPSFFEGHLQTNTGAGKFVPISRAYGFLWLFLAGVPWAGLAACFLAWCRSPGRPMPPLQWVLRIASGVVAAWLATVFFNHFPRIFLPLYETLASEYADPKTNPNLRRLINDNHAAIQHLGLYLGFLGYEVFRKDWRNALLISTVGLVNGIGWALLQNWTWARHFWPGASFNFWRCWESSGGISIGIAYGLAYFLVNRPLTVGEPEPKSSGSSLDAKPRNPDLERFGAYLGLILGLGLSIRSGLKGWANIYVGNEQYWSHILWQIFGPLILISIAAIGIWILLHPSPRQSRQDPFPHRYTLIWIVLLVQNFLAQLVTGPLSVWNEVVFGLYYLLLFLLTGVIIHHFRQRQLAPNRSS